MSGLAVTVKTSYRRRTLGLQVRAGEVIVHRPASVTDAQVADFVIEKQHWIAAKLALQAERAAERPAREFVCGETLNFFDRPRRLQVQSARANGVQLLGDVLQVNVSTRARRAESVLVREALHAWLAEQALAWFTPRARAMAQSLGERVKRVQMRVTKSKWGHCRADGVLQFNPLIMQAPEWVVHYLLAHEVCHLREPNHSPAFWSLVAQQTSEYRAARQWLKRYGHTLFF